MGIERFEDIEAWQLAPSVAIQTLGEAIPLTRDDSSEDRHRRSFYLPDNPA
jgi:hypothetical protein